MFRILLCTTLISLTCFRLAAGEIYYTSFENFSAGPDKIAGTDGWTGSGSHVGLQLSGIETEAEHLVTGIGNAAYLGGNEALLPITASRTVNVRRALTVNGANVDHTIPGQEVVQFRVNFGVKDSTSIGFTTKRDDFEFAFYNQTGNLIGYLHFDNTTIDSATQAPAQKVWRSDYRTSPLPAGLKSVDTGTTFVYDALMELVVRINFRTNRWTATLDGLALFSDLVFYAGPVYPKNMGTIAAQMQIVNSSLDPRTFQMVPAPGSNYMIFDDFAVRLDPPEFPVIWDFSRNATTGAVQISWLTEALYRYQLQYTNDDTLSWRNDLPGSYTTATATGKSPIFTDTAAAGHSKRLYRVVRTNP